MQIRSVQATSLFLSQKTTALPFPDFPNKITLDEVNTTEKK